MTNRHTTEDTPQPLGQEEWYDSEIAPALIALAKRCNERGMSFICDVEYLPDKRAGTYFLTHDHGTEMRMIYLCSMKAPNVDGFIINLVRDCKLHGIDFSSSFVMRRFAPETTTWRSDD